MACYRVNFTFLFLKTEAQPTSEIQYVKNYMIGKVLRKKRTSVSHISSSEPYIVVCMSIYIYTHTHITIHIHTYTYT